jgi:hypothetical protein
LKIEADETTTQAVSGAIMLHGCVLVGRSAGKVGYVQHTYCVQADGTIKCTTEEDFAAPRKVTCITGTPAALISKIAGQFMVDTATWTDPLETVSIRWLETVKEVTPTIGGPWQMVRLDAAGTHWLSQLPVADAAPQTAAGTCNVAVAFTAPDISITNGYLGVRMNGAVVTPFGTITGMMVSRTVTGTLTDAVCITPYVVAAGGTNGSAGQNSYMSASGFLTSNGGATQAFLGPSELSITGLPSSNPGAGSKKFWYDPSDGNRVKFAA